MIYAGDYFLFGGLKEWKKISGGGGFWREKRGRLAPEEAVLSSVVVEV